MKNFLVTGGAGFIGSHFCRLALKENWCSRLINVDALTYAGNLENLTEIISDPRYEFKHLDISAAEISELILKEKPDCILHFAAESHVDRSIIDPSLFLRTNILGTYNLLEAVKNAQEAHPSYKPRFLFVSTDEVYGSLGETGEFYETTPFSPRSPYSTSKAAADQLVTAYFHTFNLDSVIVRCSNNYGPNQFPEKLIPQTIIFALEGRKIPVYGTGSNVRDWIYVEDFARGIFAAVTKGRAGEAYNFGGRGERKNIEIVKAILQKTARDEGLIQFVTDRKGHDFRYAMNFEKSSRELGWNPQMKFEDGLSLTVNWYRDHRSWWENIFSGDYKNFFEHYYGQRLNLRPAAR